MKTNDWKERLGVMYSTNPDFKYETAEEPEEETGKMVTLVTGFHGTADDLAALGKLLRVKCGVGGSVKEGEIIVQGDFRARVVEILRAEGYAKSRQI